MADIEVNMAAKCKDLLRRLHGKLNDGEERLTQDRFEEELREWSIDVAGTVQYIAMPPVPSQLQEFYAKSPAERKKIKPEYFQSTEIAPVWVPYLNAKHAAMGENYRNIEWLKTLLDAIPMKETENRNKVHDKLTELQTKYKTDKEVDEYYEDTVNRPVNMPDRNSGNERRDLY